MAQEGNDRGPGVRIGVIQTIETVRLKTNLSAKLVDGAGKLIRQIQPDEELQLEILSGQPAQMKYAIRLAKLPTFESARDFIHHIEKRNIFGEFIHVGEVLHLGERELDNREYWIVTGNFKNLSEAQQAVQQFADFEDQTPLAIPLKPPTGEISLNGEAIGDMVRLAPDDPIKYRISVADVRVGIEFHWDHREEQDYRGVVEVRFNNQGKLLVINEVALEDYLTSVNSSEMTPDCPPDLLKAQTVAARSTIFATMGKHHFDAPFHVCADDHCQCYRGTRYEQEASARAVNECPGEVLMFENQVCDARYAKICGGVMESFEHVWENKKIPYLCAGIDGEFEIELPLDTEEKARAYIDASPDAFCNTDKYKLPKMLEFSNHLFRWKVEYEREELEQIIAEKTNEKIGELVDIRPLERGESGRLKYIEIIGSEKTIKIGKELAIRRALSKSHLYSSCFYVEKRMGGGKVTGFIFVGAGWGHGVGLCQVGATIMAQKGIGYQSILSHYYKRSELVKLY